MVVPKHAGILYAKADKTKAIVIINKEELKTKVNNFITENHMQQLNKDPTEAYQKQIHQTTQKCNKLINKHIHKHLINIKPMAPQLNVDITTHKENQPIRPVINNAQAPSYKAARQINRMYTLKFKVNALLSNISVTASFNRVRLQEIYPRHNSYKHVPHRIHSLLLNHRCPREPKSH